MKTEGTRSDGVLKRKLSGDMDEYTAPAVRAECDRLIDRNQGVRKVIINLAEVAFMDSTGIGFLIGRYKRAQRCGMQLMVERPNFAADKVLSVSGIYSLIPRV